MPDWHVHPCTRSMSEWMKFLEAASCASIKVLSAHDWDVATLLAFHYQHFPLHGTRHSPGLVVMKRNVELVRHGSKYFHTERMKVGPSRRIAQALTSMIDYLSFAMTMNAVDEMFSDVFTASNVIVKLHDASASARDGASEDVFHECWSCSSTSHLITIDSKRVQYPPRQSP